MPARPCLPKYLCKHRNAAGVLLIGLMALGSAAHAQLLPPPAPAANPVTAVKANLGKVLFWEEQMSSTRTVSCGTCHHGAAGGSDPRSPANPMSVNPGADEIFGTSDDIVGSLGVPRSIADGTYEWDPLFGLVEQVTGRKANSTVDSGYSAALFWDGRAEEEFRDPLTDAVVIPFGAALESQALGPPTSDVEMGHFERDWNDVATRIAGSEPLVLADTVPPRLVNWINRRGYPALFTEVFGTPEVTPVRIAMAIATYQRTLFSAQTPFDAFLGGDNGALTTLEVEGLDLFRSLNCDTCHRGVLTADTQFHNTGVRPNAEDEGRFGVTGVEDDRGKFRTPSLRNVKLRSPFMHSGQFDTIEEVVDFYDRGGDFDAPNKSPLLVPLNLSAKEKLTLAAFLKNPLTDPRVAAESPPFDRPTLYAESDRVPIIGNDGSPGDGGFVPEPVALEPAFLGNPSFTVGIYGGLGGTDATLAIDTSDPGAGPAVPVGGSFAFETITLAGSGAGAGWGSVSLIVPIDPALAGTTVFGRWYLVDPAAAGGVAVSPLIEIPVFQPIRRLFADDFETGTTDAWSLVVN